jgi:phospholipid/cholesterol/gamma-HCH transport system substrate-binding protein
MKESTVSTIVGATTIAGIVGLIALLMIIGGLSKSFDDGYQVTITTPDAGGLHEGSRVTYSGIDIGRIDSVDFQQSPKTGVVAVALITTDGLELPDDVIATIQNPLLGGSATAALVREPVAVAGYLPTDGTAKITGKAAVDFSKVAEELRNALGGPMEEFKRISDNFDALSKEWTLVGENVNQLVEMRSTDAVDQDEAVGNVATVMARADKRLAELKLAIEGVNQYVNDEELREDVRSTAANARVLSQRVNDSMDTLKARYVAVADDLSSVIQSMQTLTDQTLEGEGTLGKLMSDPALYENLNDASERLKAAIDDARLLVEKWKTEGLPVQF